MQRRNLLFWLCGAGVMIPRRAERRPDLEPHGARNETGRENRREEVAEPANDVAPIELRQCSASPLARGPTAAPLDHRCRKCCT